MLTRRSFPIDRIQVPAKRRRTLDPARVAAIAEDWMERGQQTPIRCRADPKAGADHWVLVEGYHRLEAARALGEETIEGYEVNVQVW